MLTRINARAAAWCEASPWTNVYGAARTFLACCTLGTLLFSSTETLFRPALGVPPAPYCEGIGSISLFCLVPDGQLELARWLSVAVLLVVASGWRPRWTAVPHWWIAFGFWTTSTIPDGGDQIAALFALVLIPVALTDPRRWHWGPAPVQQRDRELLLRLTGHSALIAARVQVAGIYLQASVAKPAVEEWADGTAVYYWMTDPSFGLPRWAEPLMTPVITSGAVVALTWGTVLLELVLFMALTMPRRAWPPLFWAGIAFHVGIGVLMGLVSFTMAMTACLLLYLRRVDRPLRLPDFVRAPIEQRFDRAEPEPARSGSREPVPM